MFLRDTQAVNFAPYPARSVRTLAELSASWCRFRPNRLDMLGLDLGTAYLSVSVSCIDVVNGVYVYYILLGLLGLWKVKKEGHKLLVLQLACSIPVYSVLMAAFLVSIN